MSKFRNLIHLAVILALAWGSLGMATPAAAAIEPQAAGDDPQPPPPSQEAELADQLAQGGAQISYHAQTGKVRFIGVSPEQPIAPPDGLRAAASTEGAARGFLATYGSLFGLKAPDEELTTMREQTAGQGRSFTRFQQVYQGIPVFGGELIVQTDRGHNVLSANGEILPDIAISTEPTIDAGTASETARQMAATWHNVKPGKLTVSQPELWIYNPELVQPGGGKTSLVWRMEVTPVSNLPIRELVLVDAQRGSIALHFNQIDTVRNRTVYDNLGIRSNYIRTPAVCTEGNCPVSTEDKYLAYKFAGDTYDYYYNNFGRDSLDGAGMELISVVNYCPASTSSPCPYPNAFWSGSLMVYGEGYASADDVVGHEMTHGVTDHESKLYYHYQSGAINESISDIFGEFIDQSNDYDGGGGAVLWELGEDIGTIRNMADPTVYGDPDKMSSGYYYEGTSDNGGVHANSGVGNKAAYLMSEGGAFNGQTIAKLGTAKVAQIYYEVQTNWLTSGSDYADLSNALFQACTNLVGTAGLTNENCQEVLKATLAVEMDQQPAAGYNPDAELCPAGLTAGDVFQDDFESGYAKWTTGSSKGSIHWKDNDPYGPNAHSGSYVYYADDAFSSSDSNFATAQNIRLPSHAYLRFHHYIDTQAGHDGGVIEISYPNGSWTDAGALINSGKAYTGTISALGNRQGFTGNSHGYVSTRVDLSSLAQKSIYLRWRMGTDKSGYVWGWWVDDVSIYTCTATGNIPPTAYDDRDYNVMQYTTLSVPANEGLLANDWDFDGDTSFTITKLSDPAHGTLALNADGSFTYTPAPADYFGPADTFTYMISDGNDDSNVATVSIGFSSASLPENLKPLTSSYLKKGVNSVKLTWKRPSAWKTKQIGYYEEQLASDEGFTNIIASHTGKSASWKVKNLIPDTQYWWRARTYVKPYSGYGLWTTVRDSQSFSTQKTAPPKLAAPKNKSLQKKATIKLTWKRPKGAPITTAYILQYDKDPGFGSPDLVEVQETGTKYIIDGTVLPVTVAPDLPVMYYWRVKATDAAWGKEYSDWSAARIFRR